MMLIPHCKLHTPEQRTPSPIPANAVITREPPRAIRDGGKAMPQLVGLAHGQSVLAAKNLVIAARHMLIPMELVDSDNSQRGINGWYPPAKAIV